MQIKNQINISQCTFFRRLLNRLSRLARGSADFCISYLYPQITLIHSHQFIDLQCVISSKRFHKEGIYGIPKYNRTFYFVYELPP